jgi:hypothetical protein
MRDSLRASLHRRLFHADIIRRTALDVVTNKGGKLENDGPLARPVTDCLRDAGALKKGRWVAVLCSSPASIGWADTVRQRVLETLDHHRGDEMPRWAYYVRNDIPDHQGLHEAVETRPDRIVYSSKYRSRFFRRQLPMLNRPPKAVVLFEQVNDFPAMLGKWNLHMDSRNLSTAQMERDGVVPKFGFLMRWAVSVVRCGLYALTVKPYTPSSRYG